jgi:hypothetical protein
VGRLNRLVSAFASFPAPDEEIRAMSGQLARILGLLTLLVLSPALAQAHPPGTSNDPRADARGLAARIDQLIDARLAKAGIKAAAPASDAEFFRRLNLDLNGRIPTLIDVTDFRDDDRADKRAIWVDRVLDNESLDRKNRFAQHFAQVLRSWMLSSNSNNIQIRFQQGFFEAWLQQKLQADLGYDRIVRDLLTSAPIVQGGPSPTAFFLDNEIKPENLAGSASRIFLGVKLECAQCHKHPTASWTKNQFWEFAAFFGNINNFQPRRPGVVPVNLKPGELRIPGTDKVARAKFLDGKVPDFKTGTDPRAILAAWMTARDNPYFAQAAVDNLWHYFFGASLLDPINEKEEGGPPAFPEILDLLTREFKAHQFDLKFLARAVVLTRAYQRTSSSTGADRQETAYYARMPVRGLTPEQLFDSVAEATEYQEPPGMAPQQFVFNAQQSPRQQFLGKFAGQDRKAEAHTSILQALFLMNGKFLNERTRLDTNKSLQTIASSPTSPARRLDTLYMMVLSRPPRPDEAARLVPYLESGGANHNPGQALADVYWVLLNSGEFSLNH